MGRNVVEKGDLPKEKKNQNKSLMSVFKNLRIVSRKLVLSLLSCLENNVSFQKWEAYCISTKGKFFFYNGATLPLDDL